MCKLICIFYDIKNVSLEYICLLNDICFLKDIYCFCFIIIVWYLLVWIKRRLTSSLAEHNPDIKAFLQSSYWSKTLAFLYWSGLCPRAGVDCLIWFRSGSGMGRFSWPNIYENYNVVSRIQIEILVLDYTQMFFPKPRNGVPPKELCTTYICGVLRLSLCFFHTLVILGLQKLTILGEHV